MKRSKRTKCLSLLLSFVMLLGLLPTAALAVERDATAAAIESVYIQIGQPTPGSSLDYQGIPGDSSYYTVKSVKWYDHTVGNYVQAGTLAVAGHDYEVQITVSTVANNRCFRQGYVRGFVNDNRGTAETTYTYDSEVVVKYRFQTKATPVRDIYVDGIDVPRPGCTPDYTPNMDWGNHTVSGSNQGNFTNGVYWYDLSNSRILQPTDTFKAGNKYRIFVDVIAKGQNYFLVDDQGKFLTSAFVNRETANAIQYMKEDPEKRLNVYYDFVCQYGEIRSVGITGLTAPVQGKMPDYSVELAGDSYALKPTSESNPFVVSGVNWYNETTGSDLTARGTFTAGHTYTATVFLVPATGYKFTDSVSGTINGNTAKVQGQGGEIQVKYTFPALATNQITSVAIEGITAPATGAFPSYVAITKGPGYGLKDRNDTYYKNGICWSILDSSDLPVSDGTKFEGGQKYQITMYLTAEEGYEFSTNAKGGLNVTATVNTKAAAVVGGSKNEIVITYYFPEATADAKITAASVTGIDAPAIGASPDYTAAIADGRYQLEGSTSAREKNGITWINNKTGNAMTVGASKFEAGVSYTVVVGLTAADGYAFVTDSKGVPSITGTINQKTAKVSGQNGYIAYLSYTFPALEEEALPPAPIVFEDVKTSDYFYTPVQWAVNEGITNGTSATKFSPNMTCSQAHILTFLWRAVDSPKPVIANPYSNPAVKNDQYFYAPFLWAWEKGLIGNTALDPNAPCSRSDVVTYLWKLEGSPKTGSANFTDIPSTAPYAQAVAWAVEQGITNGMSATTFGPDLTCTRGQIVTFLWRYSNL